MATNFYEKINKVVTSYEQNKPWHDQGIDWAANYLTWCWKWKKISKEQMEELADRITEIYDNWS